MPQVAYRAVRSRRKFNKSREIIDYMASTMDSEVKPHFIKEFDKRVKNWEHKPEFKARKFIRPDSISLNVFPAGENKDIFIWVDKGTKAHTITAKNAPYLMFRRFYVPKTRPPDRYSGPGRSLGGFVKKDSVRHPGTKARKHTEGIKEKNKPWYTRNRENAWRRAIRSV